LIEAGGMFAMVNVAICGAVLGEDLGFDGFPEMLDGHGSVSLLLNSADLPHKCHARFFPAV
jgi:hypothetical protein